MATTWTFFAFCLLPPPVAIIALLLLPLPKAFHKGLLLCCKKVLCLPFVGQLRVETVFTLLAASAFGATSWDYFQSVLVRFHQIMLHRIKLLEKVEALEKANASLQRSAAAPAGLKAEKKPATSSASAAVEMANLKKEA